MNIDEIRKMDASSLLREVDQLKKDIFNLKLNLAVGQAKDYSQLKKIRINIARCLTVLNQKRNK
ncbi:50S ribosomal protein L29 [Candidatus Babeliales bacterium]|nr:50S ribosomal protein L29 [Candidatus Babeliales bacterium]